MIEIRLATGLLERDGALLLVASRYPNQTEPLWQLPGGRAREGELLHEALAREVAEETGLRIVVEGLLYVSESFDREGNAHVLNATFTAHPEGHARLPAADAHVVELAWLPRDEALRRITTRVLREPLEAYFRGETRRYHGFPEAGISIRFADDP
jgi:8-oxo-dGTP diphosphatase